MPYYTGQKPIVGDAVSDKDRRFGTVTRIFHYGAGPAELVIEWNDGTIGIRYFCHEELRLIERPKHRESALFQMASALRI